MFKWKGILLKQLILERRRYLTLIRFYGDEEKLLEELIYHLPRHQGLKTYLSFQEIRAWNYTLEDIATTLWLTWHPHQEVSSERAVIRRYAWTPLLASPEESGTKRSTHKFTFHESLSLFIQPLHLILVKDAGRKRPLPLSLIVTFKIWERDGYAQRRTRNLSMEICPKLLTIIIFFYSCSNHHAAFRSCNYKLHTARLQAHILY